MARKRRIKWTQNSKLEVNIIINFFNKRNGSNRYSHYLKGEIKDTLKLVAAQPMIGYSTEYPHIRQALVIDDYSIFYHHSDELITVLVFWDNRRDPARLAYTLRNQDPQYLNEPTVPYENGKYRETDKMSDLICENYPMVLVMSRFGIALGFGEKNIGEVCRQNGVDACTFLTVVNFLTEEISAPVTNVSNCLSIEALITYLHNAHDYFLNFRLPHLRRKLLEAIAECPQDVAFVIQRFFDEYADEVNKHMSYEEKVVFPYVRGLLEGKKDPKYNISIFRKRHDQIEMKIIELKNILIKYYPGPGSNLLNSVLFDIFATEQDLASHNHVEDYLFMPAILALEKTIK